MAGVATYLGVVVYSYWCCSSKEAGCMSTKSSGQTICVVMLHNQLDSFPSILTR